MLALAYSLGPSLAERGICWSPAQWGALLAWVRAEGLEKGSSIDLAIVVCTRAEGPSMLFLANAHVLSPTGCLMVRRSQNHCTRAEANYARSRSPANDRIQTPQHVQAQRNVQFSWPWKNNHSCALGCGKAQAGRWRFLLQAPLFRHAPEGSLRIREVPHGSDLRSCPGFWLHTSSAAVCMHMSVFGQQCRPYCGVVRSVFLSHCARGGPTLLSNNIDQVDVEFPSSIGVTDTHELNGSGKNPWWTAGLQASSGVNAGARCGEGSSCNAGGYIATCRLVRQGEERAPTTPVCATALGLLGNRRELN